MGFQNQCICHGMQIQFFCQGCLVLTPKFVWNKNKFRRLIFFLFTYIDWYVSKKLIFLEKKFKITTFLEIWVIFLSKLQHFEICFFFSKFFKNLFDVTVGSFTLTVSINVLLEILRRGQTDIFVFPKKIWSQYDTYSWQSFESVRIGIKEFCKIKKTKPTTEKF